MDDKVESQLKVALYLRVSTEDQGEKYGLSVQRTALENLINSKGLLKDGKPKMVLAGEEYVYVEDGISGTVELEERPAFARLKEDYTRTSKDNRPFDVVAVYRIDRFARKLRILTNVLSYFEKYNIEFISASESIDTSTPFGRAMLGILGVIAELERDVIVERTQKGREEAIRAGVYMGANAPYGYKKDEHNRLAIHEDEAKHVKAIFNYFVVNKYPPQKIADLLKDQKVLTPDASAVINGKRKGEIKRTTSSYFWRADSIREILRDKVYLGIRYYGKTAKGMKLAEDQWKVSEYRHPAIILPAIFDLATEGLKTLTDRKNLTARKENDYVYLLSGLLKCDNCKQAEGGKTIMKSWTGGKKRRSKDGNISYYYFCNKKNNMKFETQCSVLPISANELEAYIFSFIRQILTNPFALFQYQKSLTSKRLEVNELQKNKEEFVKLLNAVPNRKSSILTLFEDGYISKKEMDERLKTLSEDKKRYEDELARINHRLGQEELSRGYEESFKVYAEKYGAGLENIMNDRKQLFGIIHDLIHQITVYSRPTTDKDTIAGRKKENQFIPDRIDIQLNLPQDLLRELYVQKFGVRTDNL